MIAADVITLVSLVTVVVVDAEVVHHDLAVGRPVEADRLDAACRPDLRVVRNRDHQVASVRAVVGDSIVGPGDPIWFEYRRSA